MGTNPLIEGQLVRFCGNRKAAFIDADRRYTCFSKHGMLFSKVLQFEFPTRKEKTILDNV